ncbi:MAG: 5'-nucleotidase C-terminal domain-containing protein [Myxococcota bacterium]|nr:5'-nucleotidase C-terminal domain-containing protein [Myxococcota bacterium]
MRKWAPLLTVLLGAGCVQYNDPCAVVEDAEEEIGFLAHDVYLDRPFARHTNNALGQLAADAFLRLGESSLGPPELGLINGGGIRAEGFCVSRPVLPQGPLLNGALHEILLFDNTVITLDVKVAELVQILVAGVDNLSDATQPIVGGPGNFMHLSLGSSLQLDCSIPGTTPSPGRITELRVGSRVLVQGNAVVADPEALVRVAITDFLINFGAETQEVLQGLDADRSRRPARGGIDSDLAEREMRERHATLGTALTVDPSRIVFTGCAQPSPP